MNYKILSATTQGSDIITSIKYDFLDMPVDVWHSRPQSLEDITTGIINRATSEQQKITDIATSTSLVTTIVLNETVEI